MIEPIGIIFKKLRLQCSKGVTEYFIEQYVEGKFEFYRDVILIIIEKFSNLSFMCEVTCLFTSNPFAMPSCQ